MKIVIVGAGEVGFHIASRLALENKDVVVVEKNPAALRRVSDNIDVQTVEGSGGSPVVLEEAGVRDAEILLAVTDSDETNLVACLVADAISNTTKKLARLRYADYDEYHQTFRENSPHIDTIINPEIEVVRTIDRLMQLPGAVDIGEFANGQVKFVGIQLAPDADLAGVQLIELPQKIDHRILIAALVREERVIIPRGTDRLLPGDLVYFISEESDLLKNLAVFNKQSDPVRRVMIVGGGRIALRLAKLLEGRNISAKLIEQDAARCAELAELLDRTVVLHGDGSDQSLLNEENVQEMDVVVTLTNDEEMNILTSLLVRRMGAKKAITKISKFSYFPLMLTIGMEQVVNPRLSAINTILQHIRKGKILSAISIKGEQAEVMEAEAMETSDIVDKPLKNVHIPKGVLVTGIIRDDRVIIPDGESVIRPGDRIIIFVRRDAIPRMEKLLAVRLEYF